MKKIEMEIQDNKLSEVEKLQKQLKDMKSGDKSGMQEKDIVAKIVQLKQRSFSNHFKVCSREKRTLAFSNKTNPPGVGHYHPRKEVILTNSRNPHIDSTHLNEFEAIKRKREQE